ncbi:MAG: DNA-binding protein WhiA [Clostridiales bacterium]|jgi:DNA-binding protein WhiA|nr:DNA-binding protein WhiA [Clostridiales bacterium]
MKESFTKDVRAEIENLKMDKNRAFVRDCFLSGGVLSNPRRTYHLEFSFDKKDEKNADKLLEILKYFELRPKKIARGGQFVIYLKEADEIADVLKIIRANKSLLALEEMRVEKAIANNVNRKVNFETANINKTVGAAQSQIEAIKYISEKTGLSVLSKPLEEVARLRLENESLSLTEIGELLEPPISKSGVNHRLRKILKIAKGI